MSIQQTHKTQIAYLAPEIPALSATFVYNEILGLEKAGFEVLPLSVHVPGSKAAGREVAMLEGRTHYLYAESVLVLVLKNMSMMLKRPFRYLKTLSQALTDAARVGLTNRTGLGLVYRFLVSSTVAEKLIRAGCGHLHVHFAHIPTDIAMYASRMSGIPFSFTSHANDLFERGWLLKEKVRRSRFAVTISEFNRCFLTDRGAPREKIHVVHCGVDADSFLTNNQRPGRAVPRIGTLGRMVEKKGFDVLLLACRQLKDQGVKFQLEIAGDGPQQAALEDQVRSLDLSREVSFPGPLPHDQVPGWLRGLDLFVLPCKKDSQGDMDGIPVVLMEAMLCGIAVVSTRISGIPELVIDGETGSLADPDDPPGLAEAMQWLLTDDLRSGRIRGKAISKVKSEFALGKNIEKLADMFKE